MSYQPDFVWVYRDVERPCKHGLLRRWLDRLSGKYHGKTHLEAEILYQGATVSPDEAGNDETMTVEYDSRGVFKL